MATQNEERERINALKDQLWTEHGVALTSYQLSHEGTEEKLTALMEAISAFGPRKAPAQESSWPMKRTSKALARYLDQFFQGSEWLSKEREEGLLVVGPDGARYQVRATASTDPAHRAVETEKEGRV